jgi:hypothetical protein
MKVKAMVVVFLMLFVGGTVFAGGNSNIANNVEKVAFTSTQYTIAVLDPGTSFVSDGILHIRGYVELAYSEGSYPDMPQYWILVSNMNLRLVDGLPESGPIWGTFQSSNSAGNPIPGFEGTFTGDVFDLTSLNWIVETSAHGKGPYKGWRFKSTGVAAGQPLVTIVGVIERR